MYLKFIQNSRYMKKGVDKNYLIFFYSFSLKKGQCPFTGK